MNFTNINNVIYRIQRQFKIEDLSISDCYEWIAQALRHIGTNEQLVIKIATIPIVDYKGELPCDWYRYENILERKLPNDTPTNINVETKPRWLQIWEEAGNTLISPTNKDFDFNNHLNERGRNHNFAMIPGDKRTTFSDFDYRINDHTITVNFQEGEITLTYWAIPVDENEVPLIPDEESVLEACTWKVAEMLCYQGYKFRNVDLTTNYCRAKWNFYVKSARADLRMPDIHSLNRMSNEWNSLLPRTNQYEQCFKYLGTKEELRRNAKF
jgi:hypothetical protein